VFLCDARMGVSYSMECEDVAGSEVFCVTRVWGHPIGWSAVILQGGSILKILEGRVVC
jgi:hypothetical protein